MLRGTGLFLALVICSFAQPVEAKSFRVLPYVQNPAPDAISLLWFSETSDPGEVTFGSGGEMRTLKSEPVQAKTLGYNPTKPEPGGPHPDLPWMHRVRVTGLRSGTTYPYTVRQQADTHTGEASTTPTADQPIRFLAYSDSETEPESSTTSPVDWPAPAGANRPEGVTKYLVDQTVGYRENLRLMASRQPNFILVTGDLVETGGEQRDWDEFWKHNAGEFGSIASRVPLFAALGNHENFAGPGGGYSAEGANFGTAKFRTYFEVPANNAAIPEHAGRYYRIDYGPITLITIDSSDGLPHKTAADTNHLLEGSHAPDFNPGSEQYRWLEAQLQSAQKSSRFCIVQFHHTMYGSGPHSIPFGKPNFSGQSGIAMRVLEPLFMKYGVDAVFSGHDEMLERSQITGEEVRPDGTVRPHQLNCFDVGIGGDGLRGPSTGFDNPYRKFLAHDDAMEKWQGKQLLSGGKHYGHLEVNVRPDAQGRWSLEIVPVACFPLMDETGKLTGWERRPYDDSVTVLEPSASPTK